MATDECQSSEDGDGAEEEEDEEEESDDDSEGWITPSNLKQVQQDTGHCDTVPADVQVGCVTTDFSMQVSAASWHWLQPPARLIPHTYHTKVTLRCLLLCSKLPVLPTAEACTEPIGFAAFGFLLPGQANLGGAAGLMASCFLPLMAECAAADGPPRAGSEWHADPPGPEPHPALPWLLQVQTQHHQGKGQSRGMGSNPTPGLGLCSAAQGVVNLLHLCLPQDNFRHDQGLLPSLR